MKIIALDYGEKRMGVAVGDTAVRVAAPFATVGTVEDVIRLVRDEQAGLVVVGLPITMRGARGPQAARVEEFVARLRQKLDVPVETIDERMTSKLADRVRDLYGKNVTRDALAAAAILETYLESGNKKH